MDDMVSSVPRKSRSMPGNNGGLDIAATIQHVMQNLLQPGERCFASDVVGRTNLLLSNQRERFAHRLRRVMKSRFERDFRVVQPIGIELNFGAGGASAKEVNRASLAH